MRSDDSAGSPDRHKKPSKNLKSGVAAMLAVALRSADEVLRDLNAAHSKTLASLANGSRSRIQSHANGLNGRSQKRS